MIAFDTTTLSALFIPGVPLCKRGSTTPIEYAKERLEALVERIAKTRDQIIIPTPTLSELMVQIPADRVTLYLNT